MHQTNSLAPAGWKDYSRTIVALALWMSSSIEPGGDLGGVESDGPPDLQVGHASFGNEPADVADAHPEPLGELVDGEELRQGGGIGHRSPERLSGPLLDVPALPHAADAEHR